uniref:ribosomal protein S17 n=1 Tax=Dixoniella grisea TaxID=35153 RepID=UPI001FCD6ED2|nr:ribosomal protein S17 [Dixoniella grisea]UNJ17165.1 ribosomal protein S17 [Dixoniella grisea]
MVQKEIIGKVISTVRDKTVTVAVERKIAHCKYHKIITRTKSYQVHDENNQCNRGDIIQIQQIRPISKTKKWKFNKFIKQTIHTNLGKTI